MIFDCPACGAENGVPLSVIPEEGHVLSCRRCKRQYRVFAPEDDGEDETTPPPGAAPSGRGEVTTVGVQVGQGTTEERILPKTAAEEGLDPELDDTYRLPSAARQRLDKPKSDPPPTRPKMSDPPKSRVSDPPKAKSKVAEPPAPAPKPKSDPPRAGETRADPDRTNGRETSSMPPRASKTPLPEPPPPPDPSVPGDIRAASSTSESDAPPPRPASSVVPALAGAPLAGAKGWNEPSVMIPRGPAGPMNVVRGIARGLDKAPLALKVGLVVFPIALGVVMVLSPPARKDPAVVPAAGVDAGPEVADAGFGPEAIAALAAQQAAAARADAGRGDGGDAGEEPLSAGAKSILERARTEGKKSLEADVPAPEGTAYVQGEATLRSAAARNASPVARLRSGQAVRTMETVSGATIVMVPPGGPIGFVDPAQLGALKPVAALAREIAFKKCGATKGAECTRAAEEQLATCKQSCGGAMPAPDARPDDPEWRCAEACKLAFDVCNASCAPKKGPPKKPRKKR